MKLTTTPKMLAPNLQPYNAAIGRKLFFLGGGGGISSVV